MKSIPVIKLSLVRIALKDICRMIEVRFPYGSPKALLLRKQSFFSLCCYFLIGFGPGDLYGNRKACARRTSGGQKRPSGAFLRRGRFPYGSHRLFQRIESARPAPKNTPEPITQGCFATISPVPILFAGRVSLTQQHRRFRWFLRQFLL